MNSAAVEVEVEVKEVVPAGAVLEAIGVRVEWVYSVILRTTTPPSREVSDQEKCP